MSFSIVIPTKTRSNLLACVACIRDAHETARIIVVDDFADRDEARWLREEGPENLRTCTWIDGVKPFVFARNINLGIAAAGDDDVILLNDDALLKTPLGFSWLSGEAGERPEYGVLAAAVDGACGCTEQLAQAGTRVRIVQHHTVVFISVYLRREVLDRLAHHSVGQHGQWLDERYVDYGYDDDDACERIRQLHLKLGVFDGCVVEHGCLPSSYRTAHVVNGVAVATGADLQPNRQRFLEKWGFVPGQGPSMRPVAVTPAVHW